MAISQVEIAQGGTVGAQSIGDDGVPAGTRTLSVSAAGA
jgi:hypothetical protein